jgi:hypothetical protein
MDPHRLHDLVDDAARVMDAFGAAIYIVDLQQHFLVPRASTSHDHVRVVGTLAGRAFESGEIQNSGGTTWVALVDGVDRLGVLRIDGPDDVDVSEWGEDLAGVIAQLLVTKGGYTDIFARTRRTEEMSLAAEMLWGLIPPLTIMTPRVSVAGVLEPAYDIGGDCFDYSVNTNEAFVSVFDAMGHGLGAVDAAALALASARHSRRRGLGLADTANLVNDVIEERFKEVRFITSVLVRLDLATGTMEWVNAGHPSPLLIRERRVLGPIQGRSSPPLGIGPYPRPVNTIDLQPSDRVLLYTDGVTEGRLGGHEPFGEERMVAALETATLAGFGPAETMRRGAHAILEHHGYELRDDFTMVLLEFRSSELGDGDRFEERD